MFAIIASCSKLTIWNVLIVTTITVHYNKMVAVITTAYYYHLLYNVATFIVCNLIHCKTIQTHKNKRLITISR
jgi:hypothetical protein